MEEEIKVGDYVRSTKGKIIKATWVGRSIIEGEKGAVISKTGGEVKKHSPNIFDLVEVGDYVNGFEVENVTDEHIEFYCNMRLTREQFNDWVKSIVTREAMKSVEYTIE